MEHIVKLQDICKEYTNKKNKSVRVLEHLSLEIPQQKLIMIFGESGIGKSTLLNIIALNDKPTSGKYYLNGDLVDFESERELSKLRNSMIGMVFQMYYLIPKLSVEQNIFAPFLYRSKWKKNEVKEQCCLLIRELGLENLTNKNVEELSGGEKQRVAIARAIITRPKLLICDEPTGNLDDYNTDIIMNILREASKTLTVVMVSHNKKLEGMVDVAYELTRHGLVQRK